MPIPLPLPWLVMSLVQAADPMGSALWPTLGPMQQSAPQSSGEAEAAFETRNGVALVWSRDALPEGVPYTTTPAESAGERRSAATVLAREAQKYPPGFLGAIGLKAIGVFAGCGDPDGDGFRPWVERLKGYRYFGRWDPTGYVVACHYSDDQLALTFHHEVFHHIDAVVGGRMAYANTTGDDTRWAAVVAEPAKSAYAPLALSRRERQALEAAAGETRLAGAVTDYAAKAAGEDQAETAWWFMTHLSEGLLQAADQPELPGSQRILHLLAEYAAAAPRGRPAMDLKWFERVAAGRDSTTEVVEHASNPFLAKVDAEITEPPVRAAIRAVQPAVVQIGGGTGVNLAADGVVLTAAHVVDDHLDGVIAVTFPDGVAGFGRVTAFDAHADLAVVTLSGMSGLPFAPLAAAAPEVGTSVVVIGMPGKHTPDGELTGYQPWHVSTGEIRGFLAHRRDGDQHLGRTKHDAWTYWGHSGSPIFNRRGAIVALHNSWDSKTAMRHAVAYEAIVKFLGAHAVTYATR